MRLSLTVGIVPVSLVAVSTKRESAAVWACRAEAQAFPDDGTVAGHVCGACQDGANGKTGSGVSGPMSCFVEGCQTAFYLLRWRTVGSLCKDWYYRVDVQLMPMLAVIAVFRYRSKVYYLPGLCFKVTKRNGFVEVRVIDALERPDRLGFIIVVVVCIGHGAEVWFVTCK